MIKSDVENLSIIVVTAFNLIENPNSSQKAFVVTPVKPINGELDLYVSQKLFSSVGLVIDVNNEDQIETLKTIVSRLSFSLAETLPDLSNVIGCHVINLKHTECPVIMPLNPFLNGEPTMTGAICNDQDSEFLDVKVKNGKLGVDVQLRKNIKIEQERQGLHLLLNKTERLLSNKKNILKRCQLYQKSLLANNDWHDMCNDENERTIDYKLGLFDTSRGGINSLIYDVNTVHGSELLVDGKVVSDNNGYLKQLDISDQVFKLANNMIMANHKAKNWLDTLPHFGIQF